MSKNLTKEWKIVSDERPGFVAKPGFCLVIFKWSESDGKQLCEIVKDGEKFTPKKNFFSGRHWNIALMQ